MCQQHSCLLAFKPLCTQLSSMALPVDSQFGWKFDDLRERVDYRFNFRSGAHSPRTYDFVYEDCAPYFVVFVL